MKTRALHLLPVACLLISCGEKDQPADASNDSAVANPATPKPAPASAPKPTAPKVNVAALNQQLQQALSFKEHAKGVAAIEAGADPHAKNRYGLPVIFSVAQSGNGEMIEALVAKGADPNSKIGTTYNDDGVGYAGTQDGTPLGYAAQKANLDTMQALLAAGADVNGGGKEGTTPLTLAVDAGKLAPVEWLIQNGAKDSGGAALKKISMVFNPDPERQKIIELLKRNGQ